MPEILAHRTDIMAGMSLELKRVLGTGALVAFGLAYLVPLTVFTTFGSATQLTQGHLPLAYLVTTGAMLFTSVSYAVLVPAFPAAGSAYSYARAAFGERAGFLVGWALLLDYLLLPAINYLVVGVYLHAEFAALPPQLPILAAIVLVTVLNVIGIDVVRRASLAMVILQLLFAAVFIGCAIRFAGGRYPLDGFYSTDVSWPAVLSGSAVLCLSFLGFDAVSTLSEEARDAARSVPRAILLTTLIGGLIFTLLAYGSALALPDWRSIRSADAGGLEVMAPLGGRPLQVFFLGAYVAGCVASAIASQASVARILYAMGRDAILPRAWFGILSERFRTPARAIISVGFVSLIAVVSDLDTLVSIVSFGALSAFTVVNLSVFKHFLIDERRYGLKAYGLYGLVPFLGVAATGWLWASLSRSALGVGAGWVALGVVYLLVLKARRRTTPRVP